MIIDKTFKNLRHRYGDYEEKSNGSELVKGYKPDYVLQKSDDYVILESECSTNRKMFIGCMMKAAHFLQGENTGILVIVLSEHDNTKVHQITNHLKSYFEWIKDKTNLSKVFVINSRDYWDGERTISIDSDEFRNKAHIV